MTYFDVLLAISAFDETDDGDGAEDGVAAIEQLASEIAALQNSQRALERAVGVVPAGEVGADAGLARQSSAPSGIAMQMLERTQSALLDLSVSSQAIQPALVMDGPT